jgi:hypothetical protein
MSEAKFMPIVITKSATSFSTVSIEHEIRNYLDWNIRTANVTDIDNGGVYDFKYH